MPPAFEIVAISELLGLGKESGLSLAGEEAGLICWSYADWLKSNSPNERWSQGYTANTSIGQGFVLTTPLQMASVTAAVANGGYVRFPRLLLDAPATPAIDLREHGVKPEVLDIIARECSRR